METMDNFSKEVIAEIKGRGITPRPLAYFLVRRSVFWTLAVLSVIFGALALSVAHFVFFDNEEIQSATLLASPLKWILDGTPILWLVLFGLFVGSAYLSLKKTTTGYRYGFGKALASVGGITVVMALMLISLDFGGAIYYFLTHHVSFWEAIRQTSDDLPWSF